MTGTIQEAQEGTLSQTGINYELRIWRDQPKKEDYCQPNYWCVKITGADALPRIGEAIEGGDLVVRVFDIVHGAGLVSLVEQAKHRTFETKANNPPVLLAYVDRKL